MLRLLSIRCYFNHKKVAFDHNSEHGIDEGLGIAADARVSKIGEGTFGTTSSTHRSRDVMCHGKHDPRRQESVIVILFD